MHKKWRLKVYTNGLTEVPEELGNLPALKYLYLSNNQISEIPLSFGNLSDLIELRINDNNLSCLPEALGNTCGAFTFNGLFGNPFNNVITWDEFCANPQDICGSDCTFTDAQKQLEYNTLLAFYNENPGNTLGSEWNDFGLEETCDVCELPGITCNNNGYVTRLSLSTKGLTTIPTSINNLSSLLSLSLSRNPITAIPSTIGELTNLEILGVSFSELTTIPSEIGNLTNLTKLAFPGNELSSLPSSIENLTNLSELLLHSNKFSSLPPEVVDLNGLTKIHLANNDLTSLPSDIGNLTNLIFLYVNNNDLNCLPASLGNLCASTLLDISTNPIANLTTVDEFCDDPKDICLDTTCDNLAISVNGNDITISSLDGAPVSKVQIFNASWSSAFTCFGDCASTEVVNVPDGNYFVRTGLYGSNYQLICEIEETLEVDGSATGSPCDNINLDIANGTLTVNGIANAAISKVQVFDANWQNIFSCFSDCDEVPVIPIGDGLHHIKVGQYAANYALICEKGFSPTVNNGAALVGSETEDHFFFLASKNEKSVQLEWTFNNSFTTDHFIVERSSDAGHFVAIGEVDNHYNDDGVYHFQLTDKDPQNGENVYRIKVLHRDGGHHYSDLRSADFEFNDSILSVYPNPASDYLMVDLSDVKNGATKVVVYNQLGVLMMQQVVNLETETSLRIDLQKFSTGLYTLSVKAANQRPESVLFVVTKQ